MSIWEKRIYYQIFRKDKICSEDIEWLVNMYGCHTEKTDPMKWSTRRLTIIELHNRYYKVYWFKDNFGDEVYPAQVLEEEVIPIRKEIIEWIPKKN